MEGIVDFVQMNWKDICLIVTSIVTVASLVVKLTPNKWDDGIMAKILEAMKFLSLNKAR